MNFENLLDKLEFIKKKEVCELAPRDTKELLEIIHSAKPKDEWAERMVLGYLTTICAEYMHPDPLIIEGKLDFIGTELEKGHIIVRGDAGSGAGTAMRGGKITIGGNAGENTCKSMLGGELEAETIESLANTLHGVVKEKKINKIEKKQGADIYINGKKYKKGFFACFH